MRAAHYCPRSRFGPSSVAGLICPLLTSAAEIKAPCDTFSRDFSQHTTDLPEVSSTTFRTQPPNLQPVPSMDMGFAVIGQLARHRMPQIPFLYIGSYVCFHASSGPHLAVTLLRFAMTSPPSGVVKGACTPELSNMLGTKKRGRAEALPPLRVLT